MGCGQPMGAVAESVAPGADFISKAKRHCVLQMGPPDLDDVPPGIGLGIETRDQPLQLWQQLLLQLQSRSYMDRCRENVICGLDRLMWSLGGGDGASRGSPESEQRGC